MLFVWFSDDTAEYTVEDFKEYGVIKIEKTSYDDSYILYINNPLILKSKIDILYNKLKTIFGSKQLSIVIMVGYLNFMLNIKKKRHWSYG